MIVSAAVGVYSQQANKAGPAAGDACPPDTFGSPPNGPDEDNVERKGDNRDFQSRQEAMNAAKDRAGIPRSQNFQKQWQVGDDITRKGFDNYVYSKDSASWGRYYQYETSQGTRVIVEHVEEYHFHAGQPKQGVFSNMFGQRYSPVNGRHHFYYPKPKP